MVLELCAPILAVLALREIFGSNVVKKEKLNALKVSFFIVAGLIVGLFLLKGMFDFVGPNERIFEEELW